MEKGKGLGSLCRAGWVRRGEREGCVCVFCYIIAHFILPPLMHVRGGKEVMFGERCEVLGVDSVQGWGWVCVLGERGKSIEESGRGGRDVRVCVCIVLCRYILSIYLFIYLFICLFMWVGEGKESRKC